MMPSINQATAFRAPSTVRAPLDFNRVFFQYQPPRPLHEIDAELAEVEKRIMVLLREVTE